MMILRWRLFIRCDPGDEHLIEIARQESIPILQNKDINSKEFSHIKL